MKQTITILYLLVFCNIYSQQWHLNQIDTSLKFKYQYWFQFDNSDDTSSYNFNKRIGNLNSTIQLNDNKGDTILFARVKIKNLENDTVLNMISDLNGLVHLNLRPGNYNIEVSVPGFDKFSFDFSVSENEFFNLNVRLGLAPELPVYQINSKDELNEEEILTVMKCVKGNRQDFYKECSDHKKYYVSMQI